MNLVGATIIDKGFVGQVIKGRILSVDLERGELTVMWRPGTYTGLPFAKVTAGRYDVVVTQ